MELNSEVRNSEAKKRRGTKWRLLPLRIDDAYIAMAIDEALLRLNAQGKVPNTIRFWRWLPSAVSIGYFQSVKSEVDLEAAKRYGVDVVRRITGGGAIFHDYKGELTYSVICRQNEVPADILESYRFICNGLVRGFEQLGLQAEFKRINDIRIGGKKISGSSQLRKFGSVLQHGTVLVDPDIRLMFELLKIGPEKIPEELVTSVYERVTTLLRELGRRPSFDEIVDAMRIGFEKALGVKLFETDFTSEEIRLAEELRPKYASEKWLRKR